jgi:hypothetical protein
LSGDLAILEADPRLDHILAKAIFANDNLASASGPVTVAAVARVPVEADIETVSITRNSITKVFGPLHAPVDTVIMAREDSHKPLSLDKRLHKRNISAVVRTAVIRTAAVLIALLSNAFFVEAWVPSGATASVDLEGPRGMNRNMDKGHARNCTTVLLTELAVGIAKPLNNL